MKRSSRTFNPHSSSSPLELSQLFEENLVIVFNTLSSNNKEGKISASDFRNALSAFGQSMTYSELNAILRARVHHHPSSTSGGVDDAQVTGTEGAGGSSSPETGVSDRPLLDFNDFKSLVREKVSADSPVHLLKTVVDRLLLNEDLVARMLRIRGKRGFLCDMDGVIYRGGHLLPGVARFLSWVKHTDKKILFITNNSKSTPEQLQVKLSRMGLDMPTNTFFTAALSCAAFLHFQKPHGCTAYCVGGLGIQQALKERGVVLTDDEPDYVVIGEGDDYTCEQIKKATMLVEKGAKLIGTNMDVCGPIEDGIEPSCGAWISVIERATKKTGYFTGKPNPFMMRVALQRLQCHSSEASMIGDRMDTDCIAGIETMIDPILVLSGVSTRDTIEEFPYRPYIVLNGVGEIPPDDFQFDEEEEKKKEK